MPGRFGIYDPVETLTSSDRSRLRNAWSDAPAVWRFVPKRGCPDHMATWLADQTPDAWHDIALHFDLAAADYAPLLFIAQQPNADRATIMSMLLDQDIVALEAASRKSRRFNPHRAVPQTAALLDVIAAGFERGDYPDARFRLRQDQRILGQTRTDLADLGAPFTWDLPDRAWRRVEGKPHAPEYVWDRKNSCQRLPFDVWVKLKLRPN